MEIKMKIGVITDCFKKNTRESIKLAGELGLSGVQIYATGGEFSPDALSDKDIAEYKKLLSDSGLVVSALCGDMGGHGFEIEEDNAERIEKTKRIIDLAHELGSSVVTTHIGVIPADKNDPRYSVMLRALKACGDYARTRGVTLAIETGPEFAPVLNDFVRSAGDGVGVNLDPANFVMVTGQDPAEAVRLIREKIVHTHLKDGKRLRENDAEAVYHAFAKGGIEAISAGEGFIETPVGEGEVNWDEYIAALREVGFDGFLTIEREVGPDPLGDIIKARDFAAKYI